jgi:hypothetical protein
MKERIRKIIVSPNKQKKYLAFVYNPNTKKTRKIHFGARGYAQYKDSTKIKEYKNMDHGDKKRKNNYYSRHSGTKYKIKAIKNEIKKSNGRYTAKILSHRYLW